MAATPNLAGIDFTSLKPTTPLERILVTMAENSQRQDRIITNLIETNKTMLEVIEMLSKRLKDLEAWTECP